MRSGSEDSESVADWYTAHARDCYDVSSEESSDDDSRETYGSESSSSDSSYYSEEDFSAGSESIHDYDIDDVDISIAATDVDGFSEDAGKGILGGIFDLSCGWLDKPMGSCIGFPGSRNQVSLLRESKLHNASTVRQLSKNDTIRKVTKNAVLSRKERETFD